MTAELRDHFQSSLGNAYRLERELGDSGVPPAASHGLLRRLAERFALVAFGLYHVPFFLNNYPSLGGGLNGQGLAGAWGKVFSPPGVWVARHVLHIATAGTMPSAYSGDNGDTGEEFGRLFLAFVIAVISAVAWTIADRRKPGSRWVSDAIKLLLRYSIALGLTSYAIAKIYPEQFPALRTVDLEYHVGELSPQALLWRFMEYSRPYNFFAGVMELAVVLLLTFRRTATLGALLCVVVVTNVALMNYAYIVPVKLYSTMIVISAVVLLLYDLPRLWVFFVKDGTVAPNDRTSSVFDRIPRWAQWTAKIGLVGSVLVSSVAFAQQYSTAPVPLDGGWTITSFTLDGRATEATTWRRLHIMPGLVLVRLANDSLLFCGPAPAHDSGTLSFACGQTRSELRWTRNGDVLQLVGTFDGARLEAAARALRPADYRLTRAKFRWMYEP